MADIVGRVAEEAAGSDQSNEIKGPNCVFTFKKRRTNRGGRNARKRDLSGDEKDSSGDDTVVFKKERKHDTTNPMMQKTNKLKKTVDRHEVQNSSDEEKGNVSISFKSSRTAQREGPGDMGATSVLEIETEKDRDAQAIFERAQAVNKERKGKEEDKKYRGLNNYAQYYEKRDTAQGNASSGMVRKGPIRAPENLRATVRWDYQPDICKDYKETGFCGFGDSCKFMHDRSDYKHGWQLEREVEENMYKEEDSSRYEIAAEEDEVPFKCYICRKSFKDPIVTKCKHYFCEKCALDHYKKSQRCYVCGTQTAGVFNTAKEVLAKMKDAPQAENSNSENSSSDSDD